MKRAFTLVEALILVGVLAVLALILLPLVATHHPGVSKRMQCNSNLKQIGLGFLMYAQDANGILPPSAMGVSSGWADAIQPYVKSWPCFQCPSTPNQMPASTDYFFNGRLSRGYTPQLTSPQRTILAGEGRDDAPTWTKLRQLPAQWLTNKSTPVWRHLDTGNYLFADGHVKSLGASAISTRSPKMATFTFAVR